MCAVFCSITAPTFFLSAASEHHLVKEKKYFSSIIILIILLIIIMDTSYDEFSQEVAYAFDPMSQQKTQQAPYSLSDDDDSENEGNGASSAPPRGWGRLVRLGAGHSSSDSTLILEREGLENGYWFGRNSKCDVTLKQSPHVSSKHCIVYRNSNGSVLVQDNNSSNGTFVNGERLKRGSQKLLRHGDTLSLVLKPRNSNTSSNRNNALEAFEFVFQSTASIKDSKVPKAVSDKYDILEQLGKGTYGSVHKVLLRDSAKFLAVKIIKRRFFVGGDANWERQRQEAKVMESLSHKSIIRLYDIVETDDALYIFMELGRGGELFERIIEHGPPSEDDCKILMRNLLEAVAYLHEKGIVHRDLKLENILMASPSKDCFDLKLVDFGTAKPAGQGRKTFCGSMSYIAPEVLQRKNTVKGLGSYGKGADMWSVGVIAYVCLSGRPPFNEELQDEIHVYINEVLKFDGECWATVSSQAKAFLRSLLVIDETKRLTAKDALAHPWLSSFSESQDGVHSATCSSVHSSKSIGSLVGHVKAARIASMGPQDDNAFAGKRRREEPTVSPLISSKHGQDSSDERKRQRLH